MQGLHSEGIGGGKISLLMSGGPGATHVVETPESGESLPVSVQVAGGTGRGHDRNGGACVEGEGTEHRPRPDRRKC